MNKNILFGLVVILFSIVLVQAEDLQLQNITLSSELNNATIFFNKSVNTSQINLEDNYVSLVNFSFTDETNFTLANNSIVDSLSLLNWSVDNRNIDSSNFIHRFRFNFTDTGTLLTNWTLNSLDSIGDELRLFYTAFGNEGTKNWLWEKFGYVSQTININFSYDTSNNITYNVSQAEINIRIEDKNTGNLVTGENFTLTFVATVGAQISTTTGLATIKNLAFLEEEYQLIVTSTNYNTENVFFDFDNEQNLSLTVSVINSTDTNVGFVQVKVVDKFGKPIPSVITQALQWDTNTSSYVNVGEALTDNSGIAIQNILLNVKQYIFRAVVDGSNFDSVRQIISTTQNGKQIVISVTAGATEEAYNNENLLYNVTENFANNISNINFSFVNTNGNNVIACIRYYRVFTNTSQTLISEDCTTSSSGIIQTAKLINSSYDVIAKVGFDINGNFEVQRSYVYYGEFNVSSIFKSLNIHYYILPLLYLLCVLIAYKSLPISGVGIIVTSGIALFLVPDFMTKGIVAFMLLVGLALIYVGDRK